MKPADTLIDPAVLAKGSPHSEPHSKQRPEVMDRLWTVMLNIFGHQFESSFGRAPSDDWATILAGITPKMIGTGIERMKMIEKFQEWPPNALAFRALCLPSEADLGLPTAEEAFAQAVGNRSGQSKHPAVIHTLRKIDSYSMRKAPADVARKLWNSAWKETVEHVAKGGELSVDLVALPPPVEEYDDTESPLRHSKAMKAAIRDNVGWKRKGENLKDYQNRMVQGAKKYFRDLYGDALNDPQGRTRLECNTIIAELERGCSGYHSTPQEREAGRSVLAEIRN